MGLVNITVCLDDAIWSNVKTLYQRLSPNGFVKVISSQFSWLPDWAPTIPSNPIYGYSINFADVHRMHIRRLQARLINITLSLGSDVDEWKKGGKGDLFGPTMREYGMFHVIWSNTY